MQISFSLPHVLGFNSSLSEYEAVKAILNNAVNRINRRGSANTTAAAHYPRSGAYGKCSLSRSQLHPDRVTFNLPYAFNSDSTQLEDSRVLRILLDCLTDINTEYLNRHKDVRPLYGSAPYSNDAPVFYARTRVWDPIPALYKRGYGDCKSLSAALIAQYRARGIEALPVFRWVDPERNKMRKGNTNYHILVQTAKGFEDPSKVLGMGTNALY